MDQAVPTRGQEKKGVCVCGAYSAGHCLHNSF